MKKAFNFFYLLILAIIISISILFATITTSKQFDKTSGSDINDSNTEKSNESDTLAFKGIVRHMLVTTTHSDIFLPIIDSAEANDIVYLVKDKYDNPILGECISGTGTLDSQLFEDQYQLLSITDFEILPKQDCVNEVIDISRDDIKKYTGVLRRLYRLESERTKSIDYTIIPTDATNEIADRIPLLIGKDANYIVAEELIDQIVAIEGYEWIAKDGQINVKVTKIEKIEPKKIPDTSEIITEEKDVVKAKETVKEPEVKPSLYQDKSINTRIIPGPLTYGRVDSKYPLPLYATAVSTTNFISKVEFYLNDKLVKTVMSSAFRNISVNKKNYDKDGEHTKRFESERKVFEYLRDKNDEEIYGYSAVQSGKFNAPCKGISEGYVYIMSGEKNFFDVRISPDLDKIETCYKGDTIGYGEYFYVNVKANDGKYSTYVKAFDNKGGFNTSSKVEFEVK